MGVNIATLNYVPTLSIRRSEMNGLEQLPFATKDRLQPNFLLAPWSSARELMRAIDRIEKAFPNRPFFLDIDRYYTHTSYEKQAQREWLELQDPSNNYANWLGFIEGVPNASPCLQIRGLNQTDIVQQITAIQEMGRTFALRIETDHFPDNLSEAIAAINTVGSADYAIIVDAGWVADTQPVRLAVANIIRYQLAEIGAQVPIVASYTTIPKGYTDVEGARVTPFDNRAFLQELVQLTNRQAIVYGDWGSTRPRDSGQARRGKPRIDLALRNGWLSARNKPEDWDFKEAASAVVASVEWREMIDGLGIWGEQMIRQTVVDEGLGINTAEKNVASRVNLHLHIQAFFNEGEIRGLDLDEDWQD